MRRYENDCKGCDAALYPCNHCGLENVLHTYCDKCGTDIAEVEDIYEIGNVEVCEDCLKEMAPKAKCSHCGVAIDDEELYYSEGLKTVVCWDCYKKIYRAAPYDIY